MDKSLRTLVYPLLSSSSSSLPSLTFYVLPPSIDVDASILIIPHARLIFFFFCIFFFTFSSPHRFRVVSLYLSSPLIISTLFPLFSCYRYLRSYPDPPCLTRQSPIFHAHLPHSLANDFSNLQCSFASIHLCFSSSYYIHIVVPSLVPLTPSPFPMEARQPTRRIPDSDSLVGAFGTPREVVCI